MADDPRSGSSKQKKVHVEELFKTAALELKPELASFLKKAPLEEEDLPAATGWTAVWNSLDSPQHTSPLLKTGLLRSMNSTRAMEGEWDAYVHATPEEEEGSAIDPNNFAFLTWTLCIWLMLAYSVIVTPLFVVFHFHEEGLSVLWSPYFWVNRFCDLAFFTDLALHFFVAFDDPYSGRHVSQPRKIAVHYIKHWFFMDLISVCPYDLILLVFLGSKNVHFGLLGLLKFARMARLYRIFHLAALKSVWKSIETVQLRHSYLFWLLKYITFVAFVLHFVACGLLEIANHQKTENWVVANGFETSGPVDKYIAALFWATATISNIGHGNIYLVTRAECVYALVAMSLGVFVFIHLIGHVLLILSVHNGDAYSESQELRSLEASLKLMGLPKWVQQKIWEYHSRTRSFRQTQLHQKRNKVLETLSPNLQALVARYTRGTWLYTVPMFQNLDGMVIGHISTQLKPRSFSPMEVIVHEHQHIDNLVVLLEGRVMQTRPKQNIPATVHTAPFNFGVEIILQHRYRSCVQVRAVKYSNTYFLSRYDLKRVLDTFPASRSLIRSFAVQQAFAMTVLRIRDMILSGEIATVTEYTFDRKKMNAEEDQVVPVLEVHTTEVVKLQELLAAVSSHFGQRFTGLEQRLEAVNNQFNSLDEKVELLAELIEWGSSKKIENLGNGTISASKTFRTLKQEVNEVNERQSALEERLEQQNAVLQTQMAQIDRKTEVMLQLLSIQSSPAHLMNPITPNTGGEEDDECGSEEELAYHSSVVSFY